MVGFLDPCNGIDDGYHWVLLHEGIDGGWWRLDGSECCCPFGITFGPGKRRNLSLALFGAMAPVGAAGGSLVSGAFVQNTEWKWLFFFL